MAEKLTQGNQSLDKALQIVEAMSASSGTMRLQDIAGQVGMPVSTVLRMLNTFVKTGYAYQDPNTSRYGLTYKFSTLSSPANLRESLISCGHQILLDLCNEVGESCSLIVESEDNIIHIDSSEPSGKMLMSHPYLGQSAPLYCTGAGKIFLLNRSDPELDLYLQHTEFRRFTDHTLTSPDALKKEVDTARECGWAMDNEEYIEGIRCIAAGIRDGSGSYIGSISISLPSIRMTEDQIPFLSEAVKGAAARISALMGAR